jgi:hypothetical protein
MQTLCACAKLVSQHQLASTPQTGMSLQAESALHVLHANCLRDALWTAAERVVPSMTAQEVANTVWALEKLDMPPMGSLHDCLQTAAELFQLCDHLGEQGGALCVLFNRGGRVHGKGLGC